MTDSMKFKIVWGLPSLGELEARNNLIVDTWEEEARWENDVAENTRKNKKDPTLECAKKACEIHALAIRKKKKTVRFPKCDKDLVTSKTVCTDYYRWRGMADTVYLEDLATLEDSVNT